jgi:AraC-like DNA-binding protein
LELRLEMNLSENQQGPIGGAYSIRRFTTDSLPQQDRLPVWREEFARAIVHVEIEPVSSEPFQAQATLGEVLDLRWMKFEGSAMRFHRTRQLAASGSDHVGLIINRDQGAPISHCNRELTLDEGDALACFTDEPGIIAGRSHAGLLLPRRLLASRVRHLGNAVGTRIRSGSDALRLLKGYLNALPDELTTRSTQLQRAIVDHICELAALAIDPGRLTDENSVSATAAARLELAMAYLRRHFDFPGLTISTVAGDQNISARYLQRLIETTGSTFSEHLNELRLQRAFTLLADPRFQRKQIAEIALRSGFSDVSYFNRMFRRRFGVTPRSVRGRLTSAIRN